MPGEVAIRVDNLGKKFVIGHQAEGDLRGSFSHRMGRLMGRSGGGTREEFWALKDISFEIRKGEAVGIIGRNGAGKSTLLKILSRITDPTTGRFEISGRVSSLLEVGTGFHPELTGRENIFLNGTILGMRRAEIKKKFDAIVDFSGVEKFLDTPVKHYSSGMKVRLAFSVAAHLEPEILIIDEVLAVGDAEFQKKCLGKMDEVSKSEGRTVLFVSHNMSAIEVLCSSALVLSGGRIDYRGGTSDSIERYLQQTLATTVTESSWKRGEKNGDKPLHITEVSYVLSGTMPNQVLQVETRIESQRQHQPAFLAFDVCSEDGTPIFQTIPTDKPYIGFSGQEQVIKTAIELPLLIPGNYRLSVWVGPHYSETYDWEKEILSFQVQLSPVAGRVHPHSKRHGYIAPQSKLLD